MENENLHELLKEQQYSFKPYFANCVMDRLEATQNKMEMGFEQVLDFIFPRLTTFSFGIIALFVISTAIYQGSMDIDTLLGINHYEENMEFHNYTGIY